MKRKQFARLFIVVFAPLLLLGVIVGKVIFEKSGDKYAYILCIPSYTFENCRPLGDPDGRLYKLTKNYYPAWFDVTEASYDSGSPLSNFVMASTRSIKDAVVVSAAPFAGSGSDASLTLDSLIGKRSIITLGIGKGEHSQIYSDGVHLFCSNLWFATNDGEYTSHCYGEGWGGAVTYQVRGDSRDELDRLHSAIKAEVSARERDYWVYRAVMYPLFIYIFLLVSLLVWISVKAARFVRGGSKGDG